MNKIDWSLYDYEDVSNPPEKIKKNTVSKNVNWDEYDPPLTEKEKTFYDNIKDYGKTILKGAVEGISRLGTTMGPLIENKSIPQQLKEQTQTLDELLPTDEGYIQRGLRRGLQQAPTALAFPGSSLISTLPRALAAGFLGEGAKDLQLPEWAQTAAELTAYIGPDVTKKLLEKGSNAEIIKAARELNLSDEAITPLLQSDFKTKWLAKLTPRRGATQKALEKSKNEIGEAYKTIQESEPALAKLGDEKSIGLIDDIDKILKEIPSSVRNKIKTDYDDLLKNDITGRSIMNFWADINHELGANSKQLTLIKDPLKKALGEVSPELVKDFETVNKLYSKYSSISKKLEPTLSTDIYSVAKPIGILSGLITGNYPLLTTFVTPEIAGKISQQMLLNPRFQQLSLKMANALNQNKFKVALDVTKEFSKLFRKSSPEISDQLDQINEEDFLNILKSTQNKKAKQE